MKGEGRRGRGGRKWRKKKGLGGKKRMWEREEDGHKTKLHKWR